MARVSSRRSAKRASAVRAGFRSGFEEDFARDLSQRGIEFTFEKDKLKYVKLSRSGVCLDCGSKEVGTTHNYTPDFYLVKQNIFIETKGWMKGADRTKAKSVRESNPDVDVRFIFQTDSKLNKNSKTRYSDWCKNNGFLYGFKTLPERWINE